MKRLLGTDFLGGRTEHYWLHTGDDGKDRITVETVEDVEPILDQAKREFASAPQRFGKGPFHKVASIPFVVIEEACRLKGMPLRELVADKTDRAHAVWNELLNSREFSAFRTRPGRIDTRRQ